MSDLFKKPVIMIIRHPTYNRDIPVWCWTLDAMEMVAASADVIELKNAETWHKALLLRP